MVVSNFVYHVVGHEAVQTTLFRQWENQPNEMKILLSGEDHIGKTTLAVAFVAAIHCSMPNASVPCGSCDDCRAFSQNLHPDHRTLDGEVESITIDHVRELEHFLHQTSLSYRTVILNRPEHMTRAAGHALLKALEEPPLRTIFLLITARPDQLLLTIRSRVQHIRMYRVPQDTLRRSFPTTEKNQLQRASGRPGKLTESNPGWECPIEELFLSSPINVRRDLRKILSSKKSFQERKERVSRLVDQVEQVMRGVLLAHADLSHRNESSLPESTVTTLSHHYPLSTCRTILNRIERVRQGLELNLQPELACEYLFPSHQ